MDHQKTNLLFQHWSELQGVANQPWSTIPALWSHRKSFGLERIYGICSHVGAGWNVGWWGDGRCVGGDGWTRSSISISSCFPSCTAASQPRPNRRPTASEVSSRGWHLETNNSVPEQHVFLFSNSIFLKGYVLRFFALHVLCHDMSFLFIISVYMFYFLYKCIYIYVLYIYKYIYMCRYIFTTSFIFKHMYSSHLAPTNRVDTEISINRYILYIYIYRLIPIKQ